ncbi:MAG: BsuPI-related putative proteinase inhibitor [Tuberibacillus sp.]
MFKFFLFISLLIITIGCGNANSHEQPKTMREKAEITTGQGIIAGSVSPMLNIEQKDRSVILHFSIMNQTEHPVKYTFPTSQRFDYIISTENGETIKRFSDGRMFTQSISTITLKQGETLSFDPVVTGLKRGEYLVTFWLTAHEDQFKTTAPFTVK